jgi:hypothetical protein
VRKVENLAHAEVSGPLAVRKKGSEKLYSQPQPEYNIPEVMSFTLTGAGYPGVCTSGEREVQYPPPVVSIIYSICRLCQWSARHQVSQANC